MAATLVTNLASTGNSGGDTGGVITIIDPSIVSIVDLMATTPVLAVATPATPRLAGDGTPGASFAGTSSPPMTPPPPPTGPKNPYIVGFFKYVAHTLPEVTLATLKPFAQFHTGNFSVEGVKASLFNMPAQHTCNVFAILWAPENQIKFVHSMGRYVAPMGKTRTTKTTIATLVSKGIVLKGEIRQW